MIARRIAIDGWPWRGRIALWVLAIPLLLSACFARRAKEEPVPRRSPARDSLIAVDLSRVDTLSARGFSAALSSFLAMDVAYLRPGAPIVFGRANVLPLIAIAPAQVGSIVAWQPIGGGLSRDGLAGFTHGITIRAIPERSAPAVERYIAYWTRVRSGPWRIAAYAEISDVPAVVGGPVAGTEIPRMSVTPPLREHVHAIAWADSNFAEQASAFGAAAAFSAAIADDGVLLGSPELVVGPRAVREYFEARRSVSLTWQPRYAVSTVAGDLGFTIGESVATSRGPTGAAMQRFSKYLTIWRREPGGGWKFVVDGGNQRPSPIGE